jgi:hypothetical protein
LFNARIAPDANFEVGKDGRFLIPVPVEQAGITPINVVVNWTAGLKRVSRQPAGYTGRSSLQPAAVSPDSIFSDAADARPGGLLRLSSLELNTHRNRGLGP